MIAQTFDYRKVKHASPWPPIISPKVIYLLDEGVGVCTLHGYKDGMMIHIHMDPDHRGVEAKQTLLDSFSWAFRNTDTNKIYAGIPKVNKPSCYMAVISGMKFTHEDKHKRYYEVMKDARLNR